MSINSRLKYSSYTEIIQNPTPIFAWHGIFVWVYLTVIEIMLINPTDIKFQLGRGLFIILFILAERGKFYSISLEKRINPSDKAQHELISFWNNFSVPIKE